MCSRHLTMTAPADTPPSSSPDDFLHDIRSALPRNATRAAGHISTLQETDEFNHGRFDEQLFLLRTTANKQRIGNPEGPVAGELLELPSPDGRRWLFKNAETRLYPPGSRLSLPTPHGVRIVFQPPFSGSHCWHYPEISEKGKGWHVDPEFLLDPNTGSINICCVAHHIKGQTQTLGVIKQRYTVPPGCHYLRIVAAVDVHFGMFAWLNNKKKPWSSAGCQVRATLRVPGQMEGPGPLQWAPEPILYEGFVQTPTQIEDTLQFGATIDSSEKVPQHFGTVEICIQAMVFTNTQDEKHSGAGARAIIQTHSLAVEPAA